MRERFSVFLGNDGLVTAVEISSGLLDAELATTHKLSNPAAEVLQQVAARLGEQAASTERGTSFEFATGLRLWRAVPEAGHFTTALVFRPLHQAPAASSSV